MKRVKPFWAYDVARTEEWLNLMSNMGFVLKKVNFILGIFEFEENKNKDLKYCIVYNKRFKGNSSEVPDSYYEAGFTFVYGSKMFYILSYREEEPQISPSYAAFLERNQKLSFVTGTISLCGLIIFSMLSIPFLLIMLVIGDVLAEAIITKYWYDYVFDVIRVFLFFGYLWCVYTWFTLRKTNKKLSKLCGEDIELKFTAPISIIKSSEELQDLKQDGRLIKKTKLGWAYAPDKIEKWLEKMEAQGYNLYRLSNLGNTFYFIKGEPRKIKYVVDNQKCAMPMYFKTNQEAGWELIFRSLTRSHAYVIWRHDVNGNENIFICDDKENIKRSRRLLLIYGISYFPGILIYVYFFNNIISSAFKYGYGLQFFDWFLIILCLFNLVSLSYFLWNALGYYLRMRKNYKKTGCIHN